MELGSWSIVNLFGGGPSLIGMIPLVVFIVMCMKWAKNPVLACTVPAVVGLLMCGQGPVGMGNATMASVSGFMGQMGIAVMLGSGLSKILQMTGVTTCVCKWIIKGFKVNSPKKALVVIAVTLFLTALAIGSNMTAAIICAPLLTPIAASFGIHPVVIGIFFLIICMCGAEVSPFFSTNITAMEVTGLSYPSLLVWGILPFVIVTVVACYIVCVRINKKLDKVEGSEKYELSEEEMNFDVEISPVTKRAAIAFLVVFIFGIAYMVAFGGGFAFVYFYLILLSAVVSIFAKMDGTEATNSFVAGAAGSFTIFLMLVASDVVLATVNAMGGFEALANLLTSWVGGNMNKSVLLMIASLFGIFGLNGTAAQQMLIMEELFHPMYAPLGLSMGLWSIALIFGSLVSNFLFPGGMHLNLLGMARSKDIKTMLKGTWIVCAVETVACVIFCLVLPIFF